MKNVYFDVGANNGSSMINYAKDPNNIVYAFEPTPEMINIIKSKTKNMSNYVLIEKAVSNYNGKSTFYISGQADWGCSSLNTFNDNLSVTWPGRTDFKVTNKIEVNVIKLRDFVEENKIESIEYLHCDVQGQDLEVLMGLEDKISILKSGVIEMPTRHQTKLYSDQKYIVDDAVDFLKKNNFTVTKIESNDAQTNEVNVYFVRNN